MTKLREAWVEEIVRQVMEGRAVDGILYLSGAHQRMVRELRAAFPSLRPSRVPKAFNRRIADVAIAEELKAEAAVREAMAQAWRLPGQPWARLN